MCLLICQPIEINHLTSIRWPFTRNVIPNGSNGYDRALTSKMLARISATVHDTQRNRNAVTHTGPVVKFDLSDPNCT